MNLKKIYSTLNLYNSILNLKLWFRNFSTQYEVFKAVLQGAHDWRGTTLYLGLEVG